MKSATDLDYIVIGAGMAGLHTAYRLRQQGRKVLVLEKENYAGGRMSSHEIDGHFVDFGAKFIAESYRYMLPLARELGVKPVPIELTRAGIIKKGKLYTLDGSRRFHAAWGYKGLSTKAKLRLGLAMLYATVKYRKLDLYRWADTLYLDDKSTYEDFRPLAGAESFDHLVESFSRNVLFYGTKELSRGAFYAILFKLTKIETFSFPRGIGQLCEEMAARLPVERGVEVRSVRRTPDGVVVTAKNLKSGREAVYRAKSAVMAVPGNQVLDILEDPRPEEEEFFPKVRYAATVQILGRGRTNLFDQANVIWTLPKEDSNFTALANRGVSASVGDKIHFLAALREATFRRLRGTEGLAPDHLQELIRREFPDITDAEILRVQIWESATPKLYPGYLKAVAAFLDRSRAAADVANAIGMVHFCGDYLENPSTEGALTSSIRLLKKLNR